MDIQVSSNFERLLYELLGRDAKSTAAQMSAFRTTGRMPIPDEAWRRATQHFSGFALDDAGTLAEILRVDHAGELAAVQIYRGQRAVLGAARGHGLAVFQPAVIAPQIVPLVGAASPLVRDDGRRGGRPYFGASVTKVVWKTILPSRKT